MGPRTPDASREGTRHCRPGCPPAIAAPSKASSQERALWGWCWAAIRAHPSPGEQGQQTWTACPRDEQPSERECSRPDTPQHHRETGRDTRGTGRPPPQTNDKQSRGPKREPRRGTNCLERPYQRPARSLANCARRKAGQGAETRTMQERKHTTTERTRGAHQKVNCTDLVDRADHLEWRTSRQGQRTPGPGDPLQALRATRGRDRKGRRGGEREAAPAPPD